MYRQVEVLSCVTGIEVPLVAFQIPFHPRSFFSYLSLLFSIHLRQFLLISPSELKYNFADKMANFEYTFARTFFIASLPPV